MSDGDETVDWVVSKVGLWWPDAEEGDIRKAADAWDQLATALESAGEGARGGANQALANWRGDAADGFRRQWSAYPTAIPQTAEGARSLAGGLRDYATAVENAKEEVYVLAAEIGASIAIGAAMAWFTFGTSAVAAGGAVAGIRAAAMAVATRLTAAVGQIASRALIGAAFGSVSSVAANLAVAQPLRVEVFDNGGYSLPEVEQAGLAGGLTGGLFGGAGGAWTRFRPRPGGAGARDIPGLPGAASTPDNPSAYSVAYQMRLEPTDLGRSRSVHFNRANASLDDAMRGDPPFSQQMNELSPGASDRVSSDGGRRTPHDYTWHHATSAQGGGDGAMQLVPTPQHQPGSPFQPVIHPGNAGGYSEWGIPNGAPPNSPPRK